MFINRSVTNEHQYWYWASIVWLAYLGSKSYAVENSHLVLTNDSRVFSGEHWLKAIAYPVVLQLLSQGLDEATDPQHSVIDYVHNQLSGHQVLFWIPGLMIYVSALNSVSRYLGLGSLFSIVASTTLCIAAIMSRLSSTYRLSPTSFDFAPLWLKDVVSGVNHNQSLNIFWAGLVGCLILVIVQSRLANRITKNGRRP